MIRGSQTDGGDSDRPCSTAPHKPHEVELEEAEWLRVRPHLRERPFYRQRVLFREGEPATALWAVRRGTVRLHHVSAGGRSMTLETLGPGEIFGALSALAEERYPVSAEALDAGLAWCLPREVLLRLLAENPRLGVEMLQVVSQRLRAAHQQLFSFAHDRVPTRLALALLHALRDGVALVTRRELAERAGTTVETAIRVLRRFEREGVLHGETGRLEVLDEAALRRLAGEP